MLDFAPFPDNSLGGHFHFCYVEPICHMSPVAVAARKEGVTVRLWQRGKEAGSLNTEDGDW